MSRTNTGCEECGSVIYPHFHSWQAELGTLPRVEVKVNVTYGTEKASEGEANG